VDFVECIPFSETRNYVMRVMENVQVYRAKLAGGSAPITLTADLKRGAYSYSPPGTLATNEAPTGR
jgi:soluble lytic murein transglycosylase